MKFALINGIQTEATKGARGLCSFCGSEVVAKCGEVRVNHWAHIGKHSCDPWWENETDWHRFWKDHFPIEWQEVIHFDESGEKHITDVKTGSNWALEFQHSYLKPEERRSRNAFYSKLVWVIDGLRRENDIKQFKRKITGSKAIYTKSSIITKYPVRRVESPEGCRLLEEWHDSNALVFFDFQDVDEYKNPFLWFVLPEILKSEIYLMRFPRNRFITFHKNGIFDEIITKQIQSIRKKLTGKVQNKNNRTRSTPDFFQRQQAFRNRYRGL